MIKTKDYRVTKGTIVRTILLGVVLVNMVLKASGHPILDVTESDVGAFVEMVVSAATIIVCWWKNNSYSKNAIKADEFLKRLNG